MSYDRRTKLEKLYSMVNAFQLPLIRALRRTRKAREAYERREVKPVRVEFQPHKRLLTIVFDLPATRKLVGYHLYISTQESCPIYPKQALVKARKLLEERKKWNAQADRFVAIVCPAGFTEGARCILRKSGVLCFESIGDVLSRVAEYFKSRYTRLIAALRGRRLFGELALLAYILQEILRELLGELPRELVLFEDEVTVTRAVEIGVTVPAIA